MYAHIYANCLHTHSCFWAYMKYAPTTYHFLKWTQNSITPKLKNAKTHKPQNSQTHKLKNSLPPLHPLTIWGQKVMFFDFSLKIFMKSFGI